jgi:hypothetical protein
MMVDDGDMLTTDDGGNGWIFLMDAKRTHKRKGET